MISDQRCELRGNCLVETFASRGNEVICTSTDHRYSPIANL